MAELERCQGIADPGERAVELTRLIQRLPSISAAVRAARQVAVMEMHAAGLSWSQIGVRLGLHPQRAAQIGHGVTGGHRSRAADIAADSTPLTIKTKETGKCRSPLEAM